MGSRYIETKHIDTSKFAQARKDASHLYNFVKSLLAAEEVFTQVAEAEDKLVWLKDQIVAHQGQATKANASMLEAVMAADRRVEAAKNKADAAEVELEKVSRDTAGKRRSLEEEAERDRLGLVDYKAGLAMKRKNAEEAHATRMEELAQVEEVARASMERAKKQREDLLNELKPGD